MTAQTLTYSIAEVVPYISWSYFFHAWGFPARFAAIAAVHGCDSCRAVWLASFPVEDRARAAEAMQLHKEAQRMLGHLASRGHRVRVRFALFPCNSDGDDILVRDDSSFVTRLPLLRQQTEPYLCLADFLRPQNAAGQPDRIGIFCAAADEAIELSYAGEDDYRHMLCQTLADRLAEAAVEHAHEAIRRTHWGYAPDERLSVADMQVGRFRGIRPAVGYPCLPDQSLNFDLDRLIDFSAVGISLTESGAMRPHASVSGLMIAHPEAHYFSIGHIGEDQLADYAIRKGRTPEEVRPYLAVLTC